MDTIYRLDEKIFLALNFDGGVFWDGFFKFVSGKIEWAPLYAIVLWLLWRRLGWRGMLLAAGFTILGVVLSDQICNFFKDNTPKFRPSHTPWLEGLVHLVDGRRGGLYGTVSAHAATVFSIVTLTIPLIRSRIYSVLIVFWALLICYSRIYLGMHFPLDLIFGIFTGILVGLACLWGFRKTSAKLKL